MCVAVGNGGGTGGGHKRGVKRRKRKSRGEEEVLFEVGGKKMVLRCN